MEDREKTFKFLYFKWNPIKISKSSKLSPILNIQILIKFGSQLNKHSHSQSIYISQGLYWTDLFSTYIGLSTTYTYIQIFWRNTLDFWNLYGWFWVSCSIHSSLRCPSSLTPSSETFALFISRFTSSSWTPPSFVSMMRMKIVIRNIQAKAMTFVRTSNSNLKHENQLISSNWLNLISFSWPEEQSRAEEEAHRLELRQPPGQLMLKRQHGPAELRGRAVKLVQRSLLANEMREHDKHKQYSVCLTLSLHLSSSHFSRPTYVDGSLDTGCLTMWMLTWTCVIKPPSFIPELTTTWWGSPPLIMSASVSGLVSGYAMVTSYTASSISLSSSPWSSQSLLQKSLFNQFTFAIWTNPVVLGCRTCLYWGLLVFRAYSLLRLRVLQVVATFNEHFVCFMDRMK